MHSGIVTSYSLSFSFLWLFIQGVSVHNYSIHLDRHFVTRTLQNPVPNLIIPLRNEHVKQNYLEKNKQQASGITSRIVSAKM
jgi:hypothetical protein